MCSDAAGSGLRQRLWVSHQTTSILDRRAFRVPSSAHRRKPTEGKSLTKIDHIDAIIIDVPTVRGHVLSMTTMLTQSVVLVRVRFSDGSEGLGEGASIGGLSYGPESVESVKLAIDAHIAPALVGMDADAIAAASATKPPVPIWPRRFRRYRWLRGQEANGVCSSVPHSEKVCRQLRAGADRWWGTRVLNIATKTVIRFHQERRLMHCFMPIMPPLPMPAFLCFASRPYCCRIPFPGCGRSSPATCPHESQFISGKAPFTDQSQDLKSVAR